MTSPAEVAAKPIILVVDDSPDNLSLIAGLFKEFYTVKIANSGEKALKIAQSESKPALILLDVMMPNMDGYEVIGRLKADSATRDIPVIFLTAKTDIEDEAKGLELGAVDYITKPISPPVVLARVKNHLILKAAKDAIENNRKILEDEKKLLEIEQLKTEKLMLNILPKPIADRLKRGEKNISGAYPEVTILFADLVGFTAMSSQLRAAELVSLLNDLFTRFDRRAEDLGVEKIKTIGDAYMLAGGIPIPRGDHAEITAQMALGMFDDLNAFNRERGKELKMRVGLNSGPVVAGVIGFTKFSYDLWGSTVNTASRMESTAAPGTIQISTMTQELLQDNYIFSKNGLVQCKGLGEIEAYALVGKR
jgi:class 3 adenylate cyclase